MLSFVPSVESDLARRLKNVEILLRPDLGVNLVSLSESSGPVELGFFFRLGVLTAMSGATAGISDRKNVEILLRPDLGVNLVSLSESSGPVELGFFFRLGVLTAMSGATAGI